MMFDTVAVVLASAIVAAPMALVGILGVTSLLGLKLNETQTSRLAYAAIASGLFAVLTVVGWMAGTGVNHFSVGVADWVNLPDYHFSLKLIFDRLSVPFVILSFVLCGTIAAFTRRYLHRERGYHRFFMLYSLFVLGMVLTSLAGTIETLFAGWELVGLSSVLLVAYFQERPAPVRNGLWIWVVYRVSDGALLLAAIVLHHHPGEGDINLLLGGGYRTGTELSTGGAWILAVGLLLVVAAAGKSALLPFSGWLPRAMEGPTPSSAIFYGALSVHLGAFLLLRVSPILDNSPGVSATVLILGLATALFAYLAAGVQTDIKSALALASLVQVGLIVAEIGCGWRDLPLLHILGHACLRTLQFVRAPTLLHDYHLLENALGDRPPRGPKPFAHAPARFRHWLYRFALERGYLDVVLGRCLVNPFLRLLRLCDSVERHWAGVLNGVVPRDEERVPWRSSTIEDLP